MKSDLYFGKYRSNHESSPTMVVLALAPADHEDNCCNKYLPDASSQGERRLVDSSINVQPLEGRPVSELKREIAQERPFSGPAEEALLNLLRTADCLNRVIQRKTRPYGITATQYNILRILRGSQPQGLTCTAIGDRMITPEPDITRLLGRLKVLKLIQQQRDKRDRRVIWTQISPTGLALLAEMEPMVLEFPGEMLGHLGNDRLTQLIGLLELARKHCGDPQTPVSCDGTQRVGQACPTA
jgi:DNA-binding MarR family transcriptional regulator